MKRRKDKNKKETKTDKKETKMVDKWAGVKEWSVDQAWYRTMYKRPSLSRGLPSPFDDEWSDD